MRLGVVAQSKRDTQRTACHRLSSLDYRVLSVDLPVSSACLFSMSSVAGAPPSPPPSQDLPQYSSPTLTSDFEDFHHPHFYYPEKRLRNDEAIILKVCSFFLIPLA